MMKKVTVLVDEDVYNLVVQPHKHDKTFSKLVAALLNGYLQNDFIRSYAENYIGGINKAVVNDLDMVIDEMNQSLFNIGLYHSELENIAEAGVNLFSKSANSVEFALDEEKLNAQPYLAEEESTPEPALESSTQSVQQPTPQPIAQDSTPESKEVVRPTPKPINKPIMVDASELSLDLEPEIVSNSNISPTIDANDALADILSDNLFSF